jgi:hypothetical protein
LANAKTVNTRIQNKHDLEVNWKKAVGFIPLAGELVIYDKEVDAAGNILELPKGRTTAFTYERIKVGDGVTAISDLPFAFSTAFSGTRAEYTAAYNTGSIPIGTLVIITDEPDEDDAADGVTSSILEQDILG